jgi:hypothetical protein
LHRKQPKLNNTINILENNNYPTKVIKDVTDKVKKFINSNDESKQKTSINPSKIISIPYIKGTNEQTKSLMSKHDYKIVHKRRKSLKQPKNYT